MNGFEPAAELIMSNASGHHDVIYTVAGGKRRVPIGFSTPDAEATTDQIIIAK